MLRSKLKSLEELAVIVNKSVLKTEKERDTVKEVAKEVTIEKVRRNQDRTSGEDSTVIDVGEVEKSFWLRRPDRWVVNRKMKKS
jgi:acyl CoA:acetate/3-ketoacid CoA transferase beta subunit